MFKYLCFLGVSRHNGRVVHMEYKGDGSEDTTVFLVGKGITYDTGGADLKIGGHMVGMSKDKGGAAAVAGFFKTLSILQPKGIRVVGMLALVRNSIGSNAYVADELITSRAGVRIRIGNTDAEGRMVMTDLLCEAKEKAIHAVNPFIYTIATLTGHACLSYKCYTVRRGLFTRYPVLFLWIKPKHMLHFCRRSWITVLHVGLRIARNSRKPEIAFLTWPRYI